MYLGGCPGPGLSKMWPDMSDNVGETLRMSTDNGTYESTLFGDRAVNIIEQHAAASVNDDNDGDAKPMFMYLAFHNEHDPHQA